MPIYSATSHNFYHGDRAAAPTPRRGFGGRIALAALALMLLASAGLAARASLLRAAPGLAPIYASFGLPTDPGEAVLSGVAAKQMSEAGRDVLVIEGSVSDHSGKALPVANLRLAVQDAGGREIYHWTIAAPKPRLSPDETVAFRARLEAPPAEGRHVFVRFARPGDDAWMPAKQPNAPRRSDGSA
jgi:hypothetical protein